MTSESYQKSVYLGLGYYQKLADLDMDLLGFTLVEHIQLRQVGNDVLEAVLTNYGHLFEEDIRLDLEEAVAYAQPQKNFQQDQSLLCLEDPCDDWPQSNCSVSEIWE